MGCRVLNLGNVCHCLACALHTPVGLNTASTHQLQLTLCGGNKLYLFWGLQLALTSCMQHILPRHHSTMQVRGTCKGGRALPVLHTWPRSSPPSAWPARPSASSSACCSRATRNTASLASASSACTAGAACVGLWDLAAGSRRQACPDGAARTLARRFSKRH